jgi:uncharacterized membrane protein YqjE
MTLREEDRSVEPLDSERSLGELFAQLGEDLTGLVSSQVELARKELTAEARQAVRATSLLGAGAVLGHLAFALACVAAAWGLAEVIEPGWAFLIVAAVVVVVALVLGLLGRRRAAAVGPVAPETKETLKEDVQWTRRQIR